MTTQNFFDYEREESIPKLDKDIQKIARKEGFIEFTIHKQKVIPEGCHINGDFYEIDIKGKTDEDVKEINLFVKRTLDKKNVLEVSLNPIYEVEAFTYKELFPVLKELQDQANIPEDFRFKMVQVYDESSSEAIILKNLSKEGYKTGYRNDVVTYNFAKASMEQLAKFHGLSFALERLKPIFFEEKIKPLTYPLGWLNIIDKLIENTISNIEDSDIRRKILEFTPHVADKFTKYYNIKNAPIRTMVHGDYHRNNILSKENDDEVSDVVPIDYQAIHYGCPVNDLLFFISTGTNLEFRKKHLEDLKNIYYETLRRFLKYFEIDVEEVLPRQLLEETIHSRRDLGLIFTLAFGGFLYVNDDEVLNIGEQIVKDCKYTYVPCFQERFKEFFEEYFNSE